MTYVPLTLVLIIATSALTAQCQPAGGNVAGENARAGPTPAPSPRVEQASGFEERTFTNARGERMRYLLFVPAGYDRREKYPLVLWLHGGGSRGDDLKLLLSHGDKHGVGYLARGDTQSKYPSIIVAPQCPRGRTWGDPDSEQTSREMKLALEILDEVRAGYSVDARRLYVMGMSMGGYGTWEIIARRPEMFAAAVPICGGGNTSKASLLAKTPVWAFHGDRDEAVDVSESRRMIAAVKRAGGEPRYTEYAGVAHNSWERAFAEPDLLPWMFAQKR